MPRVLVPAQAEVGVYSFGDQVKNAHRPMVNYVIQVAGLRDPMSNRGFRNTYKDGTHEKVLSYVVEDPRVGLIVESIKLLTYTHIRSEAADGHWLSFGIMDHHGRWIAPAVAEIAANALAREGYKVNCAHYDLMEVR